MKFMAWLKSVFQGNRPSKDVKAVCFGMGSSKSAGKCPGAVLDATRFSSVVRKWATAGTTVLLDGQATHSAASLAMQEAVQHSLAVIFYSGHGGRDDRDRPGAVGETDRRDEYLCFYDSMMRDDEVWQIVSNAKGRVFMVFDCCHSGTMYRAVEVGRDDAFDVVTEKTVETGAYPFTLARFKDSPAALGKEPDMLVWSAAREFEYSYGGNDGGVFTNKLLTAYGKNRTYEKMWRTIVSWMKGEPNVPVRTQFGSGFDGKIFR